MDDERARRAFSTLVWICIAVAFGLSVWKLTDNFFICMYAAFILVLVYGLKP